MIGAEQQARWNRQAKRLGRFHADHELELRRLLDWELSRRRASKDTVDICDGPAPEGGQTADTYGHVQPERHEIAVEGPDRYALPGRKA